MTNSLKAELKATTKRLAATEKTNLHLAKVHTEAKIKLANTLAKQKEGLNEINKQRKVLAKRDHMFDLMLHFALFYLQFVCFCYSL